ncbi:MAG TPA: outer membrane protein [Pirellulales bacterium]|nr:outer membrane protein [Pirellulales bacterium]
MKRFLLASVGVLAMIGMANAADLPRQMYTKAPPIATPYYNWTGFYLGINGGGGWGTGNWDSIGSHDVSGGLVGGTIGYNWQTGPWVLGLEGDIDWADISGSTSTPACLNGNCSTKNTWLGTARGRVGYSFDRWMPYITGGAAFGGVQANQPGFPGADNTQLGWTAGVGVEFAVMNNITAKVEYLHYDLGSFQCGLNCNGFPSDNVSFNADVIRGGLNFRF